MNEIRTKYLQILILSHAPIRLYDPSRFFSLLFSSFFPSSPHDHHSIIRTSDNRPPTVDFHDETTQRSPILRFFLINYIHLIICLSHRRLTQALLHRDFDIRLEIPGDRLCPPVPNR
jgi:hypothetical protein